MDKKFRIRDKTNKCWLCNVKSFHLLGEAVLIGGLLSEIEISRLNDYVVQQYTGVKDRNGEEIFEGDRIQFYHSNDEIEIGLNLPYSGESEVYNVGSSYMVRYIDNSWVEMGWSSEPKTYSFNLSSCYDLVKVGHIFDGG